MKQRSVSRRFALGCGCLPVSLLCLWLALAPARGLLPPPVHNAVALPVLEEALAPFPEPLRRLVVNTAEAAQRASMRVASPFLEVTSLRARLLDWRGRPIAGATLSAAAQGYQLDATSDEQGRAILETRTVLQRIGVIVEARAEGGAGWRGDLTVEPGQEVDLGDLRLLPGSSIAGRVVDREGEPVAGVTVTLARPTAEDVGAGVATDRRPRKVRGLSDFTDREGRFRFGWAPRGPLRAWAQLDPRWQSDGPRTDWSSSEVLPMQAGAAFHDVEIVLGPHLGPERELVGIVLSSERVPIDDGWVRLRHESGQRRGRIDEHGRFRFRRVRGERLELIAGDSRGMESTRLAAPFPPGVIELVLEPSREIVVDVCESDGRSVPEFDLHVVDAEEPYSFPPVWMRSSFGRHRRVGGHGETVRVPVPPGRFQVVALAEGFTKGMSDVLGPDMPEGAVTILLEALPTIEGKVLLDGQSVEGAKVGLYSCDENGVLSSYDRVLFALRHGGHRTTTLTDESGSYRIRPGSPETVEWEADRGYGLLRARFGEGFAEAGPFAMEGGYVRVNLDLQAPGAIEGCLRMRGGESPCGWVIAVARESDDGTSQRLEADGRFRFDGLHPGRWRVGVLGQTDPGSTYQGSFHALESPRPGGEAPSIDIVVPAGGLASCELHWQPPGPVHVEGVVSMDGRPLVHASVTLKARIGERRGPGPASSGFTDTEGRFESWGRCRGAARLSLSWCTGGRSTTVTRDVLLEEEEVELQWNLDTATLTVEPGIEEGRLLYVGTTPEGHTVTVTLDEPSGSWPIPAGSGHLRLTRFRLTRTVDVELVPGGERTIAPSEMVSIDESPADGPR